METGYFASPVDSDNEGKEPEQKEIIVQNDKSLSTT